MKKRWLVIGWVLFSFLFLFFIRIFLFGSLEKFTFPWDAPLWTILNCFIGGFLIWFFREKFKLLNEDSGSISRDFYIMVATIPVTVLILTVWSIGNEKFLFSKSHTYYDWVWEYLFNFIIQTVVTFSSISYFYISALNATKERLLAAQRAQSEMQLKILQQHIEPHFLFNNLNVLSSLIEKNPQTANEFLDKLAQLYRYILHTNNAEIVSIRDELEFAENYMYLLQKRFGAAYDFDWQIPDSKINGQMIVPTALQSLLENVVKHNAGSGKNPLRICVKLNGQSLIVENEIRPKSPNAAPSGTGLQNLRARYVLLTENPLEIEQSEDIFTVKIPLLEMKK